MGIQIMKWLLMKKYVIIGIVTICIIFGVIIVLINNKNSYTRPDYNYVATIYHSEMLGMDAGTEYVYYIYESDKNDNEYFYIKSKSNVTISGSSEKKDIASGHIRSKKDLIKIQNDIEKDSQKNSQSHVSYNYSNNGINEEYENIDLLGNMLFK